MPAPTIKLKRFTKPKNAAHKDALDEKDAAATAAAAAAWSKFPPGSKLHVSAARGLTRRVRAGVVFGSKGSTEVDVVDAYGQELADLQKSSAVVSPLGAAAIVADGSLLVHGGPRSRALSAEAEAEAPSLRAEVDRLKAELAKAKGATAPANDGRPQRLGKGSDADDKDKPKG